ncbi:MAG: GNAT family N-acetyltransferase [bacterium]|nr:GNAT family N-acetyltransferase [bacterium]
MQVIEVINSQQKLEFIEFPKRLYKQNADWVSAMDQDLKDLFDPNKNKNYLQGDAKRWLIKKEEHTIGRISAFYKTEQSKPLGGIGFFECENNQDAANLLFNTAQNWLSNKGCSFMDGPINFGEKDKYWGLLVSGFKNPSYQENFNFPYYQNLFESFGFAKIFEQTTSEISIEGFNYERIYRLSERIFKNPNYTFEHFKVSGLKKYAADFIHIYNKAWAARPDFIPITLEKIESTLVSLKPIMMEDAIWFAYANGEPAGFYVNVLDVNQIFKHLNGKMNLWAKIKFLYLRKFGKIDRIRGIVFGIIPQYQNLGLETGMIIKLFEAMKNNHPGITKSELSWIGDFNPKMHSLFNAVGAKTTKIHYTYRYTF